MTLFLERQKKMNHTLMEVLSVWWMVVVFDLIIFYLVLRVTRDK
jgi:hypothetical protein